MANFIKLTNMTPDKSCISETYYNIDKIIEITALSSGGTKLTLNITDKHGWSAWVNDDIDKVMQMIESVLSKE